MDDTACRGWDGSMETREPSDGVAGDSFGGELANQPKPLWPTCGAQPLAWKLGERNRKWGNAFPAELEVKAYVVSQVSLCSGCMYSILYVVHLIIPSSLRAASYSAHILRTLVSRTNELLDNAHLNLGGDARTAQIQRTYCTYCTLYKGTRYSQVRTLITYVEGTILLQPMSYSSMAKFVFPDLSFPYERVQRKSRRTLEMNTLLTSLDQRPRQTSLDAPLCSRYSHASTSELPSTPYSIQRTTYHGPPESPGPSGIRAPPYCPDRFSKLSGPSWDGPDQQDNTDLKDDGPDLYGSSKRNTVTAKESRPVVPLNVQENSSPSASGTPALESRAFLTGPESLGNLHTYLLRKGYNRPYYTSCDDSNHGHQEKSMSTFAGYS
ncbi:hypothetical protein ACRALDRAFT_2018420 [Sodiomyces alcalophilus JCM 7366]|uniref:uncharacterized protein n=1 Tax=Sodiomyces alcalophilus JCM 7366 TaxID=591952 RepID=UPI0039B53D06